MSSEANEVTAMLARLLEVRWGTVEDWAAHILADLKAAGYAVVKLPTGPSEYWGPEHQPQWNHYPFTRVDGDEIEVGARCEHVYRVNPAEARILAADLLAAAEHAEAHRGR